MLVPTYSLILALLLATSHVCSGQKDSEGGTDSAVSFTKFLNWEEISAAVEELADRYPELVKKEVLNETYEGRPITLLTVSTDNKVGDKPGIWIDAGIHPREWVAPSTALYILNKLLTGYESDSKIKEYVDSANFYILPVINPDGYAYTHNPDGDRMWRKNRRPCSADAKTCCVGVDLNRNFEYAFGGAGTSPYPCEEPYRGPSNFSEPESQAVRDFVTSHKDIQAFLTLHASGQYWFYPYGDKVNSIAENGDELKALAEKAAKALESVHGTRYEVGTAADLIYPAAGGSDDWAKGIAGIRYVYTLELRPGNDDFDLLPPEEIAPTGEEAWVGLSVIFDAVIGK